MALSAVLIVAGGAAAVVALRPAKQGLADDPRQRVRIQIMREHLAAQNVPYVVIAGDSHAELLNWDRLCGLPVVNLGLSGVAAIHYGKILALLQPARQAEAAIVFIGTNDLARSLRPASERSFRRFQQRFTSVIAELKRFTPRVVYAPIMPPDGDPRASTWLATESAGAYSIAAKAICLVGQCRPMDLDDARLGFREDGVHVDRSDRAVGGELYRLAERELCPGPSPEASSSHSTTDPKKGQQP